jgi:hypothetical protein
MALRALVACGVLVGALVARDAAAQDAAAKGRALYEEGKVALEAKDYATACSKFEQSYVVSGVPGALLSWADCEEKRERFATALSLWQQGEAKVVGNEERRSFVRQRAAAIVPKVSYVDLGLGAVPLEGWTITVDGKTVDPRTPVPVDAGKHEVLATAKGRDSHRHEVEVEIGQRLAVDVFSPSSVVESSGPTPPPSQPAPAPEGPNMPLLIAGSVVGGVGVLGFVGFGVTGGLMLSSCGDLGSCPAAERDSVDTLGVANAATLGIGIAGVVTGVILIAVGATTSGETTDTPVVVTGLRGAPGDVGLLFSKPF